MFLSRWCRKKTTVIESQSRVADGGVSRTRSGGLISVAKSLKRTLILGVLSLTVLWSFGGTIAGPISSGELDQLVRTGVEYENSKSWLNAIEHYESSLKSFPQSKELKHGLRRSKVNFGIERRYADDSFRDDLTSRPRRSLMQLFDDILYKVRNHYVDDLSSTSYVAHGTESLYLALANQRFLKNNLPNAPKSDVRRFRKLLTTQYWNRPVANRTEARRLVEEICNNAESILGLSGSVVALEYIFGGCNSLDDYSNCLTPDRLDDLNENIDGEFVGVGIEMKAVKGRGMHLVQVLAESPAEEGGLLPGDHIVAINGIDCREMNTDEAASLLRGPAGSRVRLKLDRENRTASVSATLSRRAVQVKSIPVAEIIDKNRGVAYLQMIGFQRTSVEELDAALSRLRRQGMKALIWDLRGNPGGLLDTAADVVDRFISDGVIVSTRGRTSEQNKTYYARRPGTWNIPIVLLIDGDSASASEIVAGAIRDHNRGRIIGRRSYGKWSVQSIYPIRGETGLRLTTAKFYSPHGRTHGKVGVQPDVRVDVPKDRNTYYRRSTQRDPLADPDISKGLNVLRDQLALQ